jgi:hypothetical protein
VLRAMRHLSEQYFTSSLVLAQALRHTISRPQTMQVLAGKSPLRRIFGMA